MKAPLSWLREYVDLPPGTPTDDLARRLTALGLKLESLERPGEDLVGPLVVGRVLTMEPEPQKNGKTIKWCSVDVSDANGTGEPQGIVCGADNFARRRPRRRRAARGSAPGRLRDLRPQDLRPRQRRDDLLGPRARPGRRPRWHHRAASGRRAAGRRRHRGAGPARRGHRVRDQPRPRLRDVAARRGPRGGARLRRPVPRPGRPQDACARRGRAGRSRWPTRPGARSSWPAPSPTSTRAPPHRPGWPAGSRSSASAASRWRSTSPTTSCSSWGGRSTATTPTRSRARCASAAPPTASG